MTEEDIKELGGFRNIWTLRRLEKISWMENITNEEMLPMIREETALIHPIKGDKGNGSDAR